VGDDAGSVFGPTPPPRATDLLFGPSDDTHANACLTHWHAEGVYARGYRTAAAHLALQAYVSGAEQDQLIYPIVYLYRHHVELVLKGIVYDATALLEQKLTRQQRNVLDRHKLAPVWDLARQLIDSVCNLAGEKSLPSADLDGVQSYIQQLDKHDPTGQSFRYSTDTKGAPSLRQELTLVNIRVFADGMETLAQYLDGMQSWIGHLLHDARSV
jgi:hypothetical protein